MSNPDGVVESFSYTISFNQGERDVEIDPAVDHLVRVRRFGVHMLKVVQFEQHAPLITYYITEDVFKLLSEGSPVAEHPTGGRLDVIDRAFLFNHEYEGYIDAQAASLEDMWDD